MRRAACGVRRAGSNKPDHSASGNTAFELAYCGAVGGNCPSRWGWMVLILRLGLNVVSARCRTLDEVQQ